MSFLCGGFQISSYYSPKNRKKLKKIEKKQTTKTTTTKSQFHCNLLRVWVEISYAIPRVRITSNNSGLAEKTSIVVTPI